MLKISTLNDKFVINHDNKTTVIPSSDFISFTYFKDLDQTYESDVNFVAEKQLDGFDILAYDKGICFHLYSTCVCISLNFFINFIVVPKKIHLKINPQLNLILLQISIIQHCLLYS